MSRRDSLGSGSVRERARRSWFQGLKRSLMLVWIGTLFVLGGAIIAAAFGFLGATKGLVDWLGRNEPFRVFFVVIGALVAIIGFILAIAGRFGAYNVLRFEEVQTTSKVMKETLSADTDRTMGRR